MPRNGGTTMLFRRYSPLNTAMVALGNSGMTPPAQNLIATDIPAVIQWYGKLCAVSA
jgi:N4-gp56 family major capsid protein